MAADEYTWKLSEIRARWRLITGIRGTGDLEDADVNKEINHYYQNEFPEKAGVDDLRTFFSGSTAVTDDGTLALAQTDIKLDEPVMRNDDEIELFRDPGAFFIEFPFDEQEQFNTTPTLAEGSSDTTAIANSAFTYDIQGYSYSKAAAETTFPSGLSTVPQNKHGAFALKINSSGTVTITEADDNSTGYDSIALAVEDLDAMDSESCFMGFIVVSPTGSGGFVPGTTVVSSEVTFTDGAPELRYPPEACCIYQEKLFIRPKADDIYRIKAPRLIRPTSFASDEAVPADPKWGPAIALGSAIRYIRQVLKNKEMAADLEPELTTLLNSISSKSRNQLIGGQVERNF
jgi:hypothetical protein